ncbi:MAG TPA: adenylate/guanylate cyclase domain-containing protein [Kiloniellales bacterium]
MERRLSAILTADLVGYTRLMGADEAGTLRRLSALREGVLAPLIADHRGRIVKLIGDGLLVEFASLVDAVSCAVAWQTATAEHEVEHADDRRLSFRIGVNLGDVIVEGDDIYGDGVNIAARLEELAEPGSICVSGDVYRQVRGKIEAKFEDLGERMLKNLIEPLRVYRIAVEAPAPAAASSVAKVLPLPDKPSIAVLPFINMSGDPDQDYFADGMVEDIITALSRMRWLFVIARNSSFTYKGRAVDVKQVGRELGVRYVLEGSVRKAGNRVRITGQLIDAATGAHLWAHRFDGTLDDVFDLQDQVAASVVGAIAPKLEQAEIERAKRKPTESLDAYDYYLRGMAGVHKWEREAHQEALSHFYKAIELDRNFASAYGMAARCYSWRKVCGWMVDPAKEVAEAVRLARRAAELGQDDALALCTAGIAFGFVAGQLEDGDALIDQALALDPNLAWAWLFSGWVKLWLGEPEVAIERVRHAMRLSPHDPHTFNMQSAIAAGHFFAGRYGEALSWAKTAMRAHMNAPLQTCVAAASAGLTGDVAEAEKAMAHIRQLDPDLRLSNLGDLMPLRRPEDFAMWAEGLRKAGLPD